MVHDPTMQPGLPALLCTVTTLICLGPSNSQSVNQPVAVENKKEGQSVIMDCEITVTWSYYTMHWYQQSSSGEMIHIIMLGSDKNSKRKERYSLVFQKSQNLLRLTISALTYKDSAVYFCAVRARYVRVGIYTDKLIFGRGTQLNVGPKLQSASKPSVFVMRNGTNVACLVKDFYPKDVNISLQPPNQITNLDPAIVVSPSGKYSAIKLGQYKDSNPVTCSVQHNNEIVHSTEFELNTNSSDNPKPTEAVSPEQTSKSNREPRVYPEKVNMISLTLLGLRLLFAKSIAVNFLLTAKLFF